MSKQLFNKSDIDQGLNIIIISYFNRMYEDGRFLEALELLSKKWTLSVDGAYCHFPDMDSYDKKEHFIGVEFAIGYPPREEDAIVIDEYTFYRYVRLACERYKILESDATDTVNFFLEKIRVYSLNL